MLKTTALLICITVNSLAQSPYKLSAYEKCWAMLHPFAALRVKHIGKEVTAVYKATSTEGLDNYSSGGRLDAFRHVFYMAAFAQKVEVRKLRKLGKAHEKANHRQFLRSRMEEGEIPDSLSSVMDLQNNELGLKLGKENRSMDLKALVETSITHIRRGEAVILKRNKNGKYLDCEGREVSLSSSDKRWNIPKCLVASDYAYKD